MTSSLVCPKCGRPLLDSGAAGSSATCSFCVSSSLSTADMAAQTESYTLVAAPPPVGSPPPAVSPPMPATPLGRVGRFELEAILGHGTFGRVYRAHDPQLDRTVALKVPRFAP